MKSKRSLSSKRFFLIISVLTAAVILGLSCAFVCAAPEHSLPDNIADVEAEHSATPPVSNTTTNYAEFGGIYNDDVLNFAYNGGFYCVRLPKGDYKLEVWGAEGGGRGNSVSGIGGRGGYSVGVYTVTATYTDIYVYVGGKGGYLASNTCQNVPGGYNGGGEGGTSSTSEPGSGGGGATHMATRSGLLKDLVNYKSSVLIVAGGGGGGGEDGNGTTTSTDPYGHGGGLTTKMYSANESDVTSSYPTYCASQTAAGNGGGFGYGANSHPSGGVGGDGGGGGGGWYGGGTLQATSGSDTQGGGGGTGYIGGVTSKTIVERNNLTVTAQTIGGEAATTMPNPNGGTMPGREESGYARITALSVNQAPTQVSPIKNISVNALGAANVSINSYELAYDSDYDRTNISGATRNDVYYMKGTSGDDLDAVPSANTGLYLNEACTINASTYMTYNFGGATNNGKQTLYITSFDKHPRKGDNGVSEDNKLTVYVRIRDRFGNKTTYGHGVYKFTVAYSAKSTAHGTNTGGEDCGGGNEYRYGRSTTQDVNLANETGQVYSAKPVGTWSLTVGSPIQLNTTVRIRAEGLLTNPDPNYYRVVIVPSEANTNLYRYGASDAEFWYMSAGTYIKRQGYTTLSITGVGSSPEWQNITFTAYLVEKSSSRGENYELPGLTYADGQSIDVNFKVDNTRPTLRTTRSNVVEVAVGGTVTVDMETYFEDIDGAITAATHSISEVIVPEYEYVQLDKYGRVVSTIGTSGASANRSFYNLAGGTVDNETLTTKGTSDIATGFDERIITREPTSSDAFLTYSVTNTTLTLTGIKVSYSQYKEDRTRRAVYSGGSVGSLTETTVDTAENPGHFYILLHITDNNEASDRGIWLPVAVKVTGSRQPVNTGTAADGQTPVTEAPTAEGEIGDTFRFAPMGINLGGEAIPFGEYYDSERGMLTKEGLIPLAIDGDSYTNADYTDPGNADNDTTLGLSRWSGKIHELVTLTSTEEQIVSSIAAGRSNYVTIKKEKIYIPRRYFGGRVRANESNSQEQGTYGVTVMTDEAYPEYYYVWGLKITLRSSTTNRYYYADVEVTDCSNQRATVKIAIKVRNSAPEILGKADVATFTYSNTHSTYEVADVRDESGEATGEKIPTLRYEVPLGATFFVTPYDVIRDSDMTRQFEKDASNRVSYPSGGFTLNGLTGYYEAGKFTVSGEAKPEKATGVKPMFPGEPRSEAYLSTLVTMLTAMNGTTERVNAIGRLSAQTSAEGATVYDYTSGNAFHNGGEYLLDAGVDAANDKLYFTHRTDSNIDEFTYVPGVYGDLLCETTGTTNYLDMGYGDKVNIGGTDYALDFVFMRAMTRTAEPATVTLRVRDRAGEEVTTVRLVIEIVNSNPVMPSDPKPMTLAATAVTERTGEDGSEITTVTPTEARVYLNTVEAEKIEGIMSDPDGDTLSFMRGRGIIIANRPDLAEIFAEKGITSFDGLTPTSIKSDEQYAWLRDYITDGNGLALDGNYIEASINTTVELYARALNSTKNIEGGVYVYFFVTDNRGGDTIGYQQVEVLDTLPVFESEGYEATYTDNRAEYTWKIESSSTADRIRARYIVGSEASSAAILRKEAITIADGETDIAFTASASDIRLLATDADKLQSAVVLSPGGNGYTNLIGANYGGAVPDLGYATGFNVSGNMAVAVYTQNINTGASYPRAPDKSNYVATLLFRIKGENDAYVWYTRSALVKALESEENGKIRTQCFDASGRWILTDWALRLQSGNEFPAEERLCVAIAYRDEAKTGGDTAGLNTAYSTKRVKGGAGFVANEAVSGRVISTVYQTISGTGIVTKDQFAAYDDYYVVEDENDAYYSTVGKAEGAGSAYVQNQAAPEKAYKYPSYIAVPSSKTGELYDTVYVPMSYFGILSSIVGVSEDNKTPIYGSYYVGYDTRPDKTTVNTGVAGGTAYDKSKISEILNAITITDGADSWTGNTLNDNPYVTIDAVDYTSNMNGAEYFGRKDSNAYYNLALATSNAENRFTGGDKAGDLFGTSDAYLYLSEQASKLPEHNFGLSFRKKHIRTGVNNITLTLDLVQCRKNTSTDGKDTETYYTKKGDARSVSVGIRVENSKLDLVTTEGGVLKYDGVTYYADIEAKAAETQSYALTYNGAPNGNGKNVIGYTDPDHTDEEKQQAKNDNAYFSADSMKKLSEWRSNDYGRLYDGTTHEYVNTSTGERAQNSMSSYFGNDINNHAYEYTPNPGKYGTASEGYSEYFTATLTNSGRTINFSTLRKTYINESMLGEVAKELKIAEKHDASKKLLGYTKEEITRIYASRGLKTEFGGTASDPTLARVYYPLKVIIYDSRGAGFDEGSYVAMEFRISITNSAPKIKESRALTKLTNGDNEVQGYEYEFNLAVGGTATVNLNDYVYDPDMFTFTSGQMSAVATETEFKGEKNTAIGKETGDYLLSPYRHTVLNTTQEQLLLGTAGLLTDDPEKHGGTDATDPDVVMYMQLADGSTYGTGAEPSANRLTFRVNRRTTGANGEAVRRFTFTMYFYDSTEARTSAYLRFAVNVTNQAPQITTTVRDVTMRVGDRLTLITSYYDEFIGGKEFINEGLSVEARKALTKLPDEGSLAYKNSNTYKQYYDSEYDRIDRSSWSYPAVMSSVCDVTASGRVPTDDPTGGLYPFIADTTKVAGLASGADLGFIGIASDDSPWGMRITSYTHSGVYFGVERKDLIKDEYDKTKNAEALALVVTANRACEGQTLTVVITDGEGGAATYTLNIKITSNPPVARDAEIEEDRIEIEAAGLYPTQAGSGEGYETATYDAYITPSEGKGETVTVGGETREARQALTIKLGNVAKDPDGQAQTDAMTFLGDGRFEVNGSPLTPGNDGIYRSKYFNIQKRSANEFVLTSTGYDTERNYETLTFYVADSGSSEVSKSVKITIRVYTMYSSLVNAEVGALTASRYNAYLAGGNAAKVKSYDKYVGLGEYADSAYVGERSVYPVMNSAKSAGNDGNVGGEVTDPDGAGAYSVKLYAFMTESGDALSAEDVNGLLSRGDNGAFSLAVRTLPNGAEKAAAEKALDERYLIGGISDNGAALGTYNTAKRAMVNKYALFSFASDGTSIAFEPKTSTLDKTILLYAEVQKSMGDRDVRIDGEMLYCGTLFRLDVEDSAPRTVDAAEEFAYDRAFKGAKGDKAVFKIYDKADPMSALFMDSDADDVVTVEGFDPNDATDASYREALGTALEADETLDWGSSTGRPRAITVTIADGLLTVEINRRIDKIEDGVYLSEVTFPLVITGVDRMGRTSKSTIQITVCNTKIAALETYEKRDAKTGVGYSFERVNDEEYTLKAEILKDAGVRVELNDFIVDPDYTASADTDSYTYVRGFTYDGDRGYDYMYDEAIDAINYLDAVYDKTEKIATLEPTFEFGDAAKMHATGFNITAKETIRNHTGVGYVYVVDRSAKTPEHDGLLIRIEVTVINDAPRTKEGMAETTLTLTGSRTDPKGVTLNIADYVEDSNDSDVIGEGSAESETYLRILAREYGACENLWSTVNGLVDDEGSKLTYDSEMLFDVALNVESYNQEFTITPIPGFYGTGKVTITVADGTLTMADTLTTEFVIYVTVLYDPKEVGALNSVSTHRGKRTEITIESLIPDIRNTIPTGTGDEETTPRIGENVFNPSDTYVLLSVAVTDNAKNFVEIEHEQGSDVWTLVAKAVTDSAKTIDVTYASKYDTTDTVHAVFYVNVAENMRPTPKYENIEFRRYAAESEGALFMLDKSQEITMYAFELFDDPENDELKLISVKSNKPSLVTAEIDGENRLKLKFAARADVLITIEVADETGMTYSSTIEVSNIDLPEPSFFQRLAASFESNKVMWGIILGCIVLAILVVIIIIVVLTKRKHAREELEALLVSEMEIEEQMLKLAGGPAPTDYQSFGYLPPSGAPAQNPGMLLGSGTQSPTPNTLELNAPPSHDDSN